MSVVEAPPQANGPIPRQQSLAVRVGPGSAVGPLPGHSAPDAPYMNDPKKRARPDGVQRGYPERQPGQEPVDATPDDRVDRRERPTDMQPGQGSPVAPGSGRRAPTEKTDVTNEKDHKDDPDSSRGTPGPEHLH